MYECVHVCMCVVHDCMCVFRSTCSVVIMIEIFYASIFSDTLMRNYLPIFTPYEVVVCF